jgi:hypothetical protein
VLHNASGALLGVSEVTTEWDNMWHDGLCILPLPELVDAEGAYILTVYFDGMYALREDFAVLPAPVTEDPEIQEPTT